MQVSDNRLGLSMLVYINVTNSALHNFSYTMGPVIQQHVDGTAMQGRWEAMHVCTCVTVLSTIGYRADFVMGAYRMPYNLMHSAH